jgi:hypothetical protein
MQQQQQQQRWVVGGGVTEWELTVYCRKWFLIDINTLILDFCFYDRPINVLHHISFILMMRVISPMTKLNLYMVKDLSHT